MSLQQISFLPDLERVDHPWKVVRRVSRQVYAELRAGGHVGRQTVKVLTALAWYRNCRQEWPTAAELTAFMYGKGRIARNDSRLVAPRLTEMLRGKVVRLADGSKARHGGGVLTIGPARKCGISGKSAHPIAIREAGSQERQVA